MNVEDDRRVVLERVGHLTHRVQLAIRRQQSEQRTRANKRRVAIEWSHRFPEVDGVVAVGHGLLLPGLLRARSSPVQIKNDSAAHLVDALHELCWCVDGFTLLR